MNDSALALLSSQTGLIKPTRYYEPDKAIVHVPRYSDELHQELSDLINERNPRPFFIDSAKRFEVDGKPKLELKGHYETYDGIRLDVTFNGTYGNLDNHMVLFSPKPGPKDCFTRFNLEAIANGADPRQKNVLSSIEMRDHWLKFYDGRLTRALVGYYDTECAEPGLAEIRRIGKLVALYDGVHAREKMDEIASKIPGFLQELRSLGIDADTLDVRVCEYQDPSEINPVTKHIDDMLYEFMAVIKLQAIVSHSTRSATLSYEIETDSRTARLSWPNVMKLTRLREGQKSGLNNQDKRLIDMLEFVSRSSLIKWFDDGDYVGNEREARFCGCLIEAREEVRKKVKDYVPLIQTTDESTLRLVENNPADDVLLFRSWVSYKLFTVMANAVLLSYSQSMSPDSLLQRKEVVEILNWDEQLKRRVMTFFECYKQDPQKVFSLFMAKDPASEIADRLYDEQEKEIDERIASKSS